MAEASPQVLAILAALIEERIGLHYGPRERELLAMKVADWAAEAGFDSLLDYYYHLRYDDPGGAELARLTDALVVNETYFFRERDALEQVVEGHLVPLCQGGARPRVWSAAASTGEEPLTLAMLLSERGLLSRVEIVATDISDRALSRARSGVHGRRSLRAGHPEDLAARYLEQSEEGVRVRAAIRDAVRFQHLNLLDAGAVSWLGRFDLDPLPQRPHLLSR